MKIFVSWSGGRSKHVAEAIKDWLTVLFPTFDIWVSSEDIRAGEKWSHELSSKLSEINFGILCLTKENVSSPWILFEAGALSKSIDTGRVVPLLEDLEFSDLPAPLSMFQAVKLDEVGVRKLVQTLSALLPNNRRNDVAIERIFALVWPDLQARLNESIAAGISKTATKALPAVHFSDSDGNIVEIDGVRVTLSVREYDFYKFLAIRCAQGAASFPYYKAAFVGFEEHHGREIRWLDPNALSGIISAIRKKFARAGLGSKESYLLPEKGRIGIKAIVSLDKK